MKWLSPPIALRGIIAFSAGITVAFISGACFCESAFADPYSEALQKVRQVAETVLGPLSGLSEAQFLPILILGLAFLTFAGTFLAPALRPALRLMINAIIGLPQEIADIIKCRIVEALIMLGLAFLGGISWLADIIELIRPLFH